MRQRMKPQFWKPQKRGRMYCSPGCGRGCTWAEYKAAEKRAQAMCRRLGKGWKSQVFENMGWHVKVISPCKRIAVAYTMAYSRYSRFHASIGKPGGPGFLWDACDTTPEGAVKEAVRVAKKHVRDLSDLIDGL